MKVQYSNNNERNDRINKLNIKSIARGWHYRRKLMTYTNWMKRRVEAFINIAFQALQQPEHKSFGTKVENGVSTPHVISVRSYAHTEAKHAKKGLFMKPCHFNP